MKSKHIKSVEHCFTDSECNAITCVLPLLAYSNNFSAIDKKATMSALEKISRRSVTFQNFELNAVIRSVELSVQLLSGKDPDLMKRLESNTQWLAEMKSLFFVLNSLHSQFQQLLQEFG